MIGKLRSGSAAIHVQQSGMDAERIEIVESLPKRAADGHKGTFGSVGIIGGSAGMHLDDEFVATMIGAPALAAMGAIRSGCGLVKIAAPSPIIDSVLTLAPFATGYGLEVDEERSVIASSAAVVLDELVRSNQAVVVGPGMGSGRQVSQMVVRLIAQEQAPVIVDADGLNALAETPDFVLDLRACVVMTPHPGEARRLMQSLSVEGDPAGDEHSRVQACCGLAQRIGCIVVLKGKGTVVSDGRQVWVCKRGTQAMGVGGSGDVLSGVIASIIAQRSVDVFTACTIAVEAHAIAGERWAAENNASGGMIASELADQLVGVIEEMRS
ncbi:MAG: NAD(P)H-hydrate dehydratase [Phycisphaerales bacterium]|nr:NAD(P)H-hydrate dehydratase [Phycisphaerales bacterium]